MGWRIGRSGHRPVGSGPVVIGPRSLASIVGVSRRSCFFGGLDLAMADAARQAVDQGGTLGIRLAVRWSAGDSVFAYSVTPRASRAYVPT